LALEPSPESFLPEAPTRATGSDAEVGARVITFDHPVATTIAD